MALATTVFLPRVADARRVFEIQAVFGNDLLADHLWSLGDNDVTGAAVVRNNRPRAAHVLAVMTEHAAAEGKVPDVIRIIGIRGTRLTSN